MLRKVGRPPAVTALGTIRSGDSIKVLSVGGEAFDRTCEEFVQYDWQRIPFFDLASGVLADDYDIEPVVTFDRTISTRWGSP